MKGIPLSIVERGGLCRALSVCVVVIFGVAFSTRAQTAAEPQSVQSRIERARSLAVTGSFTAAASELESLLAGTSDDAVRNVARILLMGIYLKQSNYTRADGLLDESFKARTKENENTTRVYYALAGSLINGVRSRLELYREFGLSPASAELPPEARRDIDQLRVLLERVVEHAREIHEVNSSSRNDGKTRNTDAIALLEDAAAVRLTLTRTSGERTRWQREVADARQRLFNTTPRPAASAVQAASRPAAAQPSAPPANDSRRVAAAVPSPSPSAGGETRPASNGGARALSSGETEQNTSAPEAPAQGTTSDASGASKGTPISVGSLVDKATQKVQPSYPSIARNMGLTGVVTVYVVVNEKGDVETVERASGPSLLQRSATDAARRWKFRPTVMQGQPVRVSGYISFNFAL